MHKAAAQSVRKRVKKGRTRVQTTLATRINAAIGRRKNGNEWFADLVGVSPSSISRWRRGAGWPTPSQYFKLAPVLKMSEEELADLVAHERQQAGVTRFVHDRARHGELLRLVEELRAAIAKTTDVVLDLDARVEALEQKRRPATHRPPPADS